MGNFKNALYRVPFLWILYQRQSFFSVPSGWKSVNGEEKINNIVKLLDCSLHSKSKSWKSISILEGLSFFGSIFRILIILSLHRSIGLYIYVYIRLK